MAAACGRPPPGSARMPPPPSSYSSTLRRAEAVVRGRGAGCRERRRRSRFGGVPGLAAAGQEDTAGCQVPQDVPREAAGTPRILDGPLGKAGSDLCPRPSLLPSRLGHSSALLGVDCTPILLGSVALLLGAATGVTRASKGPLQVRLGPRVAMTPTRRARCGPC